MSRTRITDGKGPSVISPVPPDPADDLPTAPAAGPLWSENFMFCAFDAARGAGFYTHLGTLPHDPSIWRGVFSAILPEGSVAVAKDYGRGGNERGPGSAAQSFRCSVPFERWSLRRDGVAFLTTRDELARGLVTDRAPVELTFAMYFSASASAWKMAGGHGAVFQRHYQQAGHVAGTLRVGGEAFELNTMGYRDHSVGPRDVSGLVAHSLVYASFPSGRVLQAFRMTGLGGSTNEQAYVVMDGELVDASVESLPKWSGAGDGDPGAFEIQLLAHGSSLAIRGKTQAAMYFSFDPPSELLFGRDVCDHDRSVAIVAPTVFVWDGEEGVGYLEMSFRGDASTAPTH